MDVVFYTSPKPHRLEIAETFAAGVRARNDTISFRPLGTGLVESPHVAVIIGNKTRYLIDPVRKWGCPVVCLDRAYAILNEEGLSRDRTYSRVTVNGSHPVQELGMLRMPSNRRHLFGWTPKPWKRTGDYILYAGSSQSYYDRIGITDVAAHVKDMVSRIKAHTKLKVLFRPKPNTTYSLSEIDGVELAAHPTVSLPDALAGCRTLVAEESSITVEALLSGVPAIVRGPSPTKNISSYRLELVDDPIMVEDHHKTELLDDLAYFQYNKEEYQRGQAWWFIRRLLERKVY